MDDPEAHRSRGGGPRSWDAHLPPGLVPGSFDPEDLVSGGALVGGWAARWATSPEAPVWRSGLDDSPAWWRAAQVDEVTARAAGVLSAAGAGPSTRVLWMASPSAEAIAAMVGVLRCGAALVALNPSSTEREVAHVVTDVRPVVAVVDRPAVAGWVESADATVAVLSPSARNVLAPRSGAVLAPSSEVALDAAGAEDPAVVAYTSGTTGAPKGAVLTHANLAAGVRTLALAWRWSAEDRLVLALPLFHAHGLVAGLFGALTAGASADVLGRFEPEEVLAHAADPASTLFFGVPTMYHRLVGSPHIDALGRLRLCVSGSAPLPAELWSQVYERANVAVLERYGMTETLLTISNPYDGERRRGTVGLPLPGVEMRLDREVGPDGVGELWVRGPSVSSGYFGREPTPRPPGDWFCTGDLVSVDADGYVTVRGRRTEVIISGGFNVYPAEVEAVLAEHPEVAEVAVCGVPSAEWGEVVTAWVVPSARGLTADALGGFAATRLAPYKRPRVIHLVGDLPRNAMGKVIRSRLG